MPLLASHFRPTLVGLIAIGIPSASETASNPISVSKKSEYHFYIGGGSAVTHGQLIHYDPFIFLGYYKKNISATGNHWEVLAGEEYGGVAWQFDMWPFDFLRLGIGLGIVPSFSATPGNAILIPMPEFSIGLQYQKKRASLLSNLAFNLGYGTRLSLGIGYSPGF